MRRLRRRKSAKIERMTMPETFAIRRQERSYEPLNHGNGPGTFTKNNHTTAAFATRPGRQRGHGRHGPALRGRAEAEHWEAVGFLHDYDYQQYPEEHLRHTEAPLCEAGVDEESIRAILAPTVGGLCSDVEPLTEMEKSLYVVDAASALVGAAAKMRPTGISDLQASSVTKKFKDRSFAATVNRETINKGAAMLGMERAEIFTLCIEGMRPHAIRLGITAK